jgi:formamidopyrimidine-DNA glycosylase
VFLVRTVEPPLGAAHGRRVTGVERLGKRVVLAMEEDLFLVFHLMIAGRFRWGAPGAGLPGKIGLAAFDFPEGTLLLTEASSRRRASLHVLKGRGELQRHDPGGIDVFAATPEEFRAALTRENHTLKRTLTDPRVLSGIGNAYSDEILHRARLSPVALTSRLSPEESQRLLDAARSTLAEWTTRLRAEVGDGFPAKVTAFREGMAVHGKFGKPCPDCGSPVQRIAYAENETNYCATCQTGGKLLADRALSRLMKEDWPRTLAEWEELYSRG